MRINVQMLSVGLLGVALMSGCASVQHYDDATLDVLAQGGLARSRTTLNRMMTAKADIEKADHKAPPCDEPTPEERKNLHDDFKGALGACADILSGYEAKADNARGWMLALATIGTIAGSIIVPALAAKAVVAKSSIAAWGGVSGATNFAQQAIVNEGLGPNDFVKTREGIRADLRKAIDEYTTPGADYCAQAMAIAKMVAACTAYAIQSAPQQINLFKPSSKGGDKKGGDGSP